MPPERNPGSRSCYRLRPAPGGCKARRRDRHRPRDAVQVLPRRRVDPGCLARPPRRPPPRISRQGPGPSRRQRRRAARSRPHCLRADNPRAAARHRTGVAGAPRRAHRPRRAATTRFRRRSHRRRRAIGRAAGRHRARRAGQLLPARPRGCRFADLGGCGPPARQRDHGRAASPALTARPAGPVRQCPLRTLT